MAGVLTADAERAFFLGLDSDVYSVETASGESARLTHDQMMKHSLQVSDDGLTVAYSLDAGDIVVIRSRGETQAMPVNLSALNGFGSHHRTLSPDGRLILAYSSRDDLSGLYMLNLAVDIQSDTGQELAPSFYAASTPTFAMSGHQDRFDVLLAPEGPIREEVETAL